MRSPQKSPKKGWQRQPFLGDFFMFLGDVGVVFHLIELL
jgi:hypothetical protein